MLTCRVDECQPLHLLTSTNTLEVDYSDAETEHPVNSVQIEGIRRGHYLTLNTADIVDAGQLRHGLVVLRGPTSTYKIRFLPRDPSPMGPRVTQELFQCMNLAVELMGVLQLKHKRSSHEIVPDPHAVEQIHYHLDALISEVQSL
jgi:hypothetical protein